MRHPRWWPALGLLLGALSVAYGQPVELVATNYPSLRAAAEQAAQNSSTQFVIRLGGVIDVQAPVASLRGNVQLQGPAQLSCAGRPLTALRITAAGSYVLSGLTFSGCRWVLLGEPPLLLRVRAGLGVMGCGDPQNRLVATHGLLSTACCCKPAPSMHTACSMVVMVVGRIGGQCESVLQQVWL